MSDFLDSTHHNISWINKRDNDGELELKPDFQRKPVWSDKQKAYLIDSILRGYPIPELYFQETTDENGNDSYVVVDGQQRVRACLDFIRGKFSLLEEDSPEWADLSFDDLSKDLRTKFFAYNFVVRKLPAMAAEELRAIFMRINKNVVALNKQELRHATYWGKFIKCCEEVSNNDLWTTFGVFTPNDIRRMLDVEFISEIVAAILHGLQNKKANLDKFYLAYEESFDREREVKNTFTKVLSEISSVIPDLERSRWRKKSDFYTLFLAFSKHIETIPFASEQRTNLARELARFASDVDQFISDTDNQLQHRPEVRAYGGAVERAASDLSSRRARQTALNGVFEQALAAEPQLGTNVSA